MGAEENKPEEKKEEEVKKPEEEAKKPKEEEAKKPEAEEKKAEEEPKEPPPPENIVLKVFMHCEGCARKVRRCLKNFEGVEDVQTDCKSSLVIVKGPKADPLKVLERVQRKSHRQVELLSPIPKPPAEGEKKEEDNKENIKPEEEKKKEEVIITVVMKVHMHCEACAQEIQKRILRMKGVKTAESALKASEVTVKGIFDPPKLVEYVYKRTGKHAMIVKTEPEPEPEKKEEEKPKEENTEKKEEGEKGEGEKKEGEGGEAKPAEEEANKPETEEATKTEMELKKNEFYYYHPLPKYNIDFPYPTHIYSYPPSYAPQYPPQFFSDENPNACSVM